MTLDPILGRALVTLAVGVVLILAGLILDPLALLDRIRH